MTTETNHQRPVTSSTAPTETETVIEVRGLRCRYEDFEAVRGIDLTVRRGELFALLGTNGAGKTTTLETLEGHRAADDGEATVLGLDPGIQRRELATRIGVMFQHSGLMDDLTTTESLRTWAGIHGYPDLDVDRLLTRVRLEHRGDVRTKDLSGGERRRLELATAVVNDPDLVFLDEPTTGMDPEARVRTWELIRDLLRQGTTVVLTTHYLEEAEQLADRLAIMHNGEIATAGTLTEVVAAQPARITCRIDDEPSAQLPTLHGDVRTNRVRGETEITILTRELQTDLFQLLSWADEQHVTLHQLAAQEASLAEIFHGIATTTKTNASQEVR